HKTSLFGAVIDSKTCQDLMDRFTTLFWTKRKWFFTHQHYYLERSNHGFFYSIQPYSMIPLSQLTKVTINSDSVCFSNIIKILYLIPNCKKLILTSLSSEGRDFSLLQCTKNFRYLSHKNTITNITIKSCKFKEVELLVSLCPRLQHLTINVLQEEFQSFIKYLLSNNGNTRYLHSLFIRSTGDIWIEKVMNIITEMKQQNDVSIKLDGYFGCYLWWE
ncbi:unnamed protein product, partial [Adineta steineri]